MTSFLFLTIIEMAPSSCVHQRDHIQKKMKIPYPSCSVLPNLTPMLLQPLHAPPPWPLFIPETWQPYPTVPRYSQGYISHLSLIYTSFPQKLLLWEAAQLPHLEYQPPSLSIPETHFFPPKQLFQVDIDFVLFNLFVGVFFPL